MNGQVLIEGPPTHFDLTDDAGGGRGDAEARQRKWKDPRIAGKGPLQREHLLIVKSCFFFKFVRRALTAANNKRTH